MAVTVSKKVVKITNCSRETNEPVAHVGSDSQLRNNQTGEIIEDTSKNKNTIFDITNPFGMARSGIPILWMYKGITTPMKRVCKMKICDLVKFSFVKLAGT